MLALISKGLRRIIIAQMLEINERIDYLNDIKMVAAKNVRESNFELLRIVLMLLVLLIHYTPIRIADMTGSISLTDNIWQDLANL